MPPPPSASCSRKFSACMPGTSKRSTSPCTRWDRYCFTAALVNCAGIVQGQIEEAALAQRAQLGHGLIPSRQDAHVLADDAEHDLVGATADGRQARVAVGAADGVFPHIAHA